MNNAHLLFVHALSPLHAGTGQGVGVIDLPIAREQATGLPYLPGSSIKGTLREVCPAGDREMVFGPEQTNAADNAGSAQFTDARLLLLPVRSLLGTFAWVTSPYILHRFAREARDAGATDMPATVPNPGPEQCAVTSSTSTKISSGGQSPKVYLEDLDLGIDADNDATTWASWLAGRIFPATEDAAWQAMLPERFCVVPDDTLTFLLETATEITARIRLDPMLKTVAPHALWYEEALPAETILAGLVVITPVYIKSLKKVPNVQDIEGVLTGLTSQTMQFGGKATVGRGLCRTQWSSGGGD